MLYILWVKVRDWATFSSGLPALARQQALHGDIWGENFWQRLPLVFFLFCLQSLYFPLNQIATHDVQLKISWLDGVMPLVGIFVIPYMLGLFFIGAMGLFCAAILPRHLFQEFVLALLVVMLIGFTIWLIMPASIYKAPFTPHNLFERWTYNLHSGDADYGTHNSFPSSHVFYITLFMYILGRRWHQWWFIWATFAVINAWSTLFTHQHYFVDVLAGLLLTIFGIWLSRYILLPRVQAWESQNRTNLHG